MTEQVDDRQLIERRNFLKLSSTGAFTAAVVAAGGGFLWSEEAVAMTKKEEKEREKAAETVMTIATAYALGASRSYPIMQLDLKENIQNASRGKIYVKLSPAGQLGAGGALIQKIQSGTIQAAQHSLANFAAFAPAADLVNLPYFCGTNQRFVNLVNSDAWAEAVHPKLEAKGFKALCYIVIDPRVVAVRKGGAGAIITPEDMKGVKFRVPGSQMLQQYYRMVGANPTPIAWGETPSAIKQGVADALDPSAGALYVFGFKDVLSHITFTQAVPDAQVYSCNLEWFNSLSPELQEAVEFASEMTAHQNLAKVPSARSHAIYEMGRNGVEFHALTDDQMSQWVEAGGYQRSEWDVYKKDLAGSMEDFNKLAEAAETRGKYFVHDA